VARWDLVIIGSPQPQGEQEMSRSSSPRPAAPRQTDIAKLAKVSQWAVSVILNDRPEAQRVPEATRDRVLRIANELGYVPNAAARTLRGGRNNLIGLLVYQDRMPLVEGSPHLAYLRGMETEAAKRELDIVLFTSALGHPRRTQRNSIYRGGSNRLHLADGTIIFGTESDLDELHRLSDEGYRFVYLGPCSDPGRELASVRPDYASGVKDLVATMVARGHRRLGLVVHHELDDTHDPQASRQRAFRQALLDHDLPVGVEIAVPDLDHAWLAEQRDRGVTALVVTDQPATQRLLAVSRAARIRIPETMSVGIAEQVPGGPRAGCSWSCTAIPREFVGARAISMLADLLERPWPVPSKLPTELIPCEPVVGATIVAPPATH